MTDLNGVPKSPKFVDDAFAVEVAAEPVAGVSAPRTKLHLTLICETVWTATRPLRDAHTRRGDLP